MDATTTTVTISTAELQDRLTKILHDMEHASGLWEWWTVLEDKTGTSREFAVAIVAALEKA